MKVGIYTIAKNEAANVQGWARSCVGADSITFCDTGSTDHTAYKAQEAFCSLPVDVKIRRISINPWRFDDAHNAALALVPADMDVCIPLHLDERLMPGWREVLEAGWKEGATKVRYTYVFSHFPDGTPELQFTQDRIHARHGYRWKYPDHEGVYPYNIKEQAVEIPDLRIEQWSDRSKDRSGTLMRLAMGVREYPNDPRMAFYFGRELMYYGQWKSAISELERYLKMENAPFYVERVQAAECLVTCYRNLQ